ncbi:hypothetical protein DFJ58DRAFT_770116 [Suillus subalutaceus]|uniref:uncharacterized protein n=1 Tax=Suillus subalutaceus TaxID=48586 RepID=UPI001B874CC1|nr:uncharacterized protein DFJ58DRAFT_770116 [Suillus subalutaceus]KAG1865764.1 hypothetical protein DFJ58DRAFT_770116 [Suillus subalutaceus]
MLTTVYDLSMLSTILSTVHLLCYLLSTIYQLSMYLLLSNYLTNTLILLLALRLIRTRDLDYILYGNIRYGP